MPRTHCYHGLRVFTCACTTTQIYTPAHSHRKGEQIEAVEKRRVLDCRTAVDVRPDLSGDHSTVGGGREEESEATSLKFTYSTGKHDYICAHTFLCTSIHIYDTQACVSPTIYTCIHTHSAHVGATCNQLVPIDTIRAHILNSHRYTQAIQITPFLRLHTL